MIADYYLIKKQQLNIDALFDDSPDAEYHYNGGFNRKAILAWLISGYIVVGSVWPNILVFGLDDLQIWAVAVDMLGSLVHHLAHWFIWQSHANRPSHHKLGIARHVSIGGLFHLSPSFLPLFMDRFCFAISLS
jgi:cytosine/uracil/thiamine/allantoin permease